MIWFACKQCDKRHGRAEALSGTLVFCECGHGNRVPWSSTVPEPEAEPARPAPPPPPRGRIPRSPLEEDAWQPEFPQPRRSRERRRPDPAYCLNHEDSPKEMTCDACHGSFCAACVIALQGQMLCGPCKNFRVRGLNRPGHFSPLAIIALVLSLIGGPVAALLALMAIGAQTAGGGAGVTVAVMICLIAVLLPVASVIVGWFGLRQIESKPNMIGRSLAMTGATTGLAATLLCLAIAVLTIAKQWQG
ncbi:MAG TPA: hypothetical protein VN688_00420 [Gemmataceae bacterium]|nr:hypothetical protein [Gemmataceae bacterium]